MAASTDELVEIILDLDLGKDPACESRYHDTETWTHNGPATHWMLTPLRPPGFAVPAEGQRGEVVAVRDFPLHHLPDCVPRQRNHFHRTLGDVLMRQLDFVASNVEQVSAIEQARYELQRVQVARLVRAQGFDAVCEAQILEALDLP